MIQRLRSELYNQGQVRCDFSGQSVQDETVWHCERHRAAAVHPFGFDLAGEALGQYTEFQQIAWLYQRLLTAADQSFEPSEAAQADAEIYELEAKLHAATAHKFRENVSTRKADC